MHIFQRITVLTLLSIYVGSARCLPVVVSPAEAGADSAKRDSIGVTLDGFVDSGTGSKKREDDDDFGSKITNNPIKTSAFVPSGEAEASGEDIFRERDGIDLSSITGEHLSRKPVATNTFISSGGGGGDFFRRAVPSEGEEVDELLGRAISLDELTNKPVVLTTFTSDGGGEARRRRDISLDDIVSKPVVLTAFTDSSSSSDSIARRTQEPGANAVAFVSSDSSGGDIDRRGHDGNLYSFSSGAASSSGDGGGDEDLIHQRDFDPSKISFAPVTVSGNFANGGDSDSASISFAKKDLSNIDLAAAGIKPYGTKGQVDLSGSFTSSSDSSDIIS